MMFFKSISSRSSSFFKLITFIFLLSHLVQDVYSQQQRIGGSCKMSNRERTSGVCKLLKNCPPALSNLRSGISPTLCKIPQVPSAVCCQAQPTISKRKCEEYKSLLYERVYSASPLLPVDEIDKNEYNRKEIKCSALSRGVGFIAGGRNAKAEEFPHMAAIGWGDDPSSLSFKCGGTLISDKFVLTAAHCIPTQNEPTYVLVGDINLKSQDVDSRRQLVRISSITIHPQYKRPKKYNDIAIIRLTSSVKFSQAVRPACMPPPVLRLENRKDLTTTGWGQIGFDEPSDILQAVNLTRYTERECNSYYNDESEKREYYPKGIIKSQMCAGDKNGAGKDTCQGDSGGPLIVHDAKIPCLYYVVGITSFGANVCGYQPGVYTNVQSYVPWIEQIVWPINSPN